MKSSTLPGPIKRILVINVARIGDTLLAVPVLRALRHAYPQSEIVCLAHPKRLEVLYGLPYLNKCGAITKRTARFYKWFGASHDLALVFGKDRALIDYALHRARFVVAQRTGDAKLDQRLFSVIEHEGMMHAVADRLRWTKALGITPTSLRLEYRVFPEESKFAIQLIGTLCSDRRPIIGFQIASFPTKAYRNWSIDNFALLGKLILDSFPNAHILILGDRRDRNAALRLKGALGQRCSVITGQLSLRQTAAVIQRLDLYLGVDTGPTHLAGALGVPMVALYHCLHPGRYLAPLEHPSYLGIVEHPRNFESASESVSMDEISVDRVWAEIKRALSGDPS